MNWKIIWQELGLTGELGLRGWMSFLFVLCAIATLLYYFLMRGALRNYFQRFSTPDKNYPKEIEVRTRENARIILERIWFNGQWRYIVKGNLPYHRFPSPEREYDEFDKNMKAPEERWLKNLDALTKPGGD